MEKSNGKGYSNYPNDSGWNPATQPPVPAAGNWDSWTQDSASYASGSNEPVSFSDYKTTPAPAPGWETSPASNWNQKDASGWTPQTPSNPDSNWNPYASSNWNTGWETPASTPAFSSGTFDAQTNGSQNNPYSAGYASGFPSLDSASSTSGFNPDPWTTSYAASFNPAKTDDVSASASLPNPFKNKIVFWVLLGVLGIAVLGGGAFWGWKAWSHRDRSAIMVCESTVPYNQGIGVTFHVGEDGKTITSMDKKDTVTLDFLKENLGTDNPEEIMASYQPEFRKNYEDLAKKYSEYSWITSEINSDDTMIQHIFHVNVSDPTFDYETAKPVLEELGLQYYYNEEAGAFIYDENEILKPYTGLGTPDMQTKCVKSDASEQTKAPEKTESKSEEKDSETKSEKSE